jgi:phosphoglycerol transferase MdoB-like AlkP superfamily enzyme
MSAKRNSTAKRQPVHSTGHVEKDSTFFLKLVVYVLAGTFWLKIQPPIEIFSIPLHGIPIGLFLGLLFARHDHFQIDRKIEYAVLIIITIITYFLPAGIVI